MKKILVIGSANADLLLHVPRMPLLGETVTGHDFTTNAGGKGLNQAVAVKKLGGTVSFWGCLGEDSHGRLLLDALRDYDIPFVGTVTKDASTGIAVVTVVHGDNFIMLHPGANGAFSPRMVRQQAERIAEADYVVLQLEIPLETVLQAAEIAHEAGTKVILNPAPAKTLPDRLYPLVDYLIPNEHEAQTLTGIAVTDEDSCKAAMTALRRKGVETVLITLGDRGCCRDDGSGAVFTPAVPARVVDTTSAGDTFIGGLCCRLAAGDTLDEAVRYATKAAAITVSRSGAACSIPCAREVE